MVKSLLLLTLSGLSILIAAAPIEAVVREEAAAGKRGLAYNDAALTKLFGSSNGKVSWAYNWDSVANGAEKKLNFVPMLHSNINEHTQRWAGNVDKSIKAGSTHVFSFNEPDQCGGGGACMQDIAKTVAAHKKHVQPLASKYSSIKIGAPAITNGVKDPNTGAKMGIPYLKEFLKQCTGCKIDFVVAHWYDSADNIAYFKKHLQDVYEAGGKKPVWLTEFAPISGDAQKFLKEVLPWMDKQSWIQRYAYQMTAKGVLVNSAGDGLSNLGKVYATT